MPKVSSRVSDPFCGDYRRRPSSITTAARPYREFESESLASSPKTTRSPAQFGGSKPSGRLPLASEQDRQAATAPSPNLAAATARPRAVSCYPDFEEGVISAILTVVRLLPVFPDQQTFSDLLYVSRKCHEPTYIPKDTDSIFLADGIRRVSSR